MSAKKTRKQLEKVLCQIGLEHMQQNYYPVYENIGNKQPDGKEEKSILDCKCEEAALNELGMKKRQLYETVYQQRKNEYYKKELEKEHKARVRVMEQQQELKYLVKNLQSQLKEVEKGCHRLEKEQKKNYQNLKTGIKKKNKKQERKISSIKNILGFILYMAGIPYYGESLKEIEKYCKDKSKYTKKSINSYIDGHYKEIS